MVWSGRWFQNLKVYTEMRSFFLYIKTFTCSLCISDFVWRVTVHTRQITSKDVFEVTWPFKNILTCNRVSSVKWHEYSDLEWRWMSLLQLSKAFLIPILQEIQHVLSMICFQMNRKAPKFCPNRYSKDYWWYISYNFCLRCYRIV